MRFKRNKSKKRGFFARFIRSTFAVVILTSLVLGVSVLAKSASSLSPDEFAHLISPVLSKVGLNEKQAGTVAGELVHRVEETGISSDNAPSKLVGAQGVSKVNLAQPNSVDAINNKEVPSVTTLDEASNSMSKNPIAVVAIMSDSGDESDNLKKALNKAKALEVDYVFHLGDLTAWGDIESLQAAKDVLDDGGLPWVAIPGDHDLAESQQQYGNGGLENFISIYKKTYFQININDIDFVIFDNSANMTPLDSVRLTWALENIRFADFILVSQPIYHHSPTELMSVMGVVKGEEIDALKKQSDLILSAIRESSVKAVFAGDHHMSSKSSDPIKNTLTHYVTGAVAKDRNVQAFPRFYLLEVYGDGTYEVTEILF